MTNKLAYVFPGQGSQSQGMLADFQSNAIVSDVFTKASSVLGYDLWDLIQNGPAEKLNQTEITQPAILAVSYAIWQMVFSDGSTAKPSYLAGHSLGEYTAWVCAESLSFESAIDLVAKRGMAMQQAVPKGQGAMAAIIGLKDEDVSLVCDKAAEGAVCAPANFNSVGQVVIAGDEAAVKRAMVLAKEQGAKLAKQLPVSVPSHCALMANAAKAMQPLLEATPFESPKIPVINNVDVKMPSTSQAIREGLLRQLTQAVRWVETIKALQALEVSHVTECGPGKVLTGLNKRIDKGLTLTCAIDQVSLSG